MEDLDDLARLMAEPPGGHLNYSEDAADGLGRPIESSSWRKRTNYVRPTKPTDTIRHGTASAYTTDKCRCKLCRAGWAAYVKARRNRGSS